MLTKIEDSYNNEGCVDMPKVFVTEFPQEGAFVKMTARGWSVWFSSDEEGTFMVADGFPSKSKAKQWITAKGAA